jgi:DNA-binding CsgD family transcriptional regulator
MAVPPFSEPTGLPRLPPRQQQTLQRLLAGDSEKEAARSLHISRHTLHVYVKEIYRTFQVNSRGELFAKCYRHVTERAGDHGGRRRMLSAVGLRNQDIS